MSEESEVDESLERQTFIDIHEAAYREALRSIDQDVKALVDTGKDMQAVVLFSSNLQTILRLHESLQTFYSLIYVNREMLEHFESKRLEQLGHKVIPTYDTIRTFDVDPKMAEEAVMENMAKCGFHVEHWAINSRLLTETEYMIASLRVLMEPDFVPLDNTVGNEGSSERPDRHISRSVKIAVWRRDEGKCVECGSKEKLEYDHIIPVSKGGSSTERNVQLLCQNCNRQKSANIQ